MHLKQFILQKSYSSPAPLEHIKEEHLWRWKFNDIEPQPHSSSANLPVIISLFVQEKLGLKWQKFI